MWYEHDARQDDCRVGGDYDRNCESKLRKWHSKIRIRAEKGYHPAHIQLQKGIPAEITFHRATPSNCYKEILFEEEGILEPIGVDEEKVIRFTPQELGRHEFSCGMKMQKEAI